MNNEHVYYLNGKQVVPKDYNAQREITLTLVRYKAEYVGVLRNGTFRPEHGANNSHAERSNEH